jgi:DNA repair exonuclease SbcCD ATPase subunit/DNA repair exonuclease SbcCD nuclease subunit
MRDLIAGDLHLNNANYGRVDKDGFSFRTRDFCQAFERTCDDAIELRKKGKLDRVTIVGDTYENPHPHSNVREFLNAQVRSLSEAGLIVDILVGNHDACYFHHALQPIRGAGFKNVNVYYSPAVVETDDTLRLIFPHSEAIERQEISFRDAIHKFAKETADQVKLAREAGKDVLFFGHFPTSGATMSGCSVNLSTSDINMDDLEMLRADYIFLGDFHMHQKLPVEGCFAFYVGSLERDDFNDIATDKGYMIYDSEKSPDKDMGKASFHKYSGRDFIDITCRADNAIEEITSLSSRIKDSVVRIHFVGTTEEHMAFSEQRKEVRNLLDGAKHVVWKKSVVDPVNDKKVQQLRHDLEEIGHIESSDMESIVANYLQNDIPDQEEREAVIRLAKQIMSRVKESQSATASGKPGRVMIHGVKMYNFQRYGEDKNVVEFDQGAAEFLGPLGESFKMDKETKKSLSKKAKKFIQTISRDDKKLISIVGRIDGNDKDSNGAGKSSILESISYTLFEKLVREFAHKEKMDGKSTTSVMTYIDGKPKSLCYCEILFSSEGELWLAKRGRKTSKGGATSGELALFCLSSEEGEEGSHSGHVKRDAEGTLRQLLRMDYETFSNSVMFGQMDSGRFIRGTDKVKKEILIKILQLTILDDYLAEIREMKKGTDKDIVAIQSSVGALAESVMSDDSIKEAKAGIAGIASEIAELDKQIAELDVTIQAKRGHPVFTERERTEKDLEHQAQLIAQKESEFANRIADLEISCNKAKNRQDAAKNEVKDVSNRIVLCQSGIETLVKLLEVFSQVQYGKDMDLVAKAKAAKPQRQAELSEGQTKLQTLASEKGMLVSQIDSLSDRIKTQKDELQASEQLAIQCQSEIERLIKLSAEFSRVSYEKDMAFVDQVKASKPLRQKELSEGQARLQTFASDKGKLVGQIGALTARIEKFQSKLTAKEFNCPECENVVSPDHFERKMKESTKEKDALDVKLAELGKAYAEEEAKVAKTRQQITEIETHIAKEAGLVAQKSSFDRNVEKLEQQKQALTKATIDKKTLESKIQAETADLTSLTSKLEDLEKAHSVEATKVAEIQKKIANIETYMAMESDLVSKKLAFDRNTEKLGEQKQALLKLGSDKKSLESKEHEEMAEVASCMGKLDDAKNAKQTETAPLRAKRDEMRTRALGLDDLIGEIKKEISELAAKLSSVRTVKDKNLSDAASMETRISESEKVKGRIASKSDELIQKQTLMRRLLKLEEIFGLDGIRTQVIEKYIPLLNSFAAEFLDVISKGRMTGAVTMDDGKMDIAVAGAAAPRGELLSGGEFERLRLSMDIALGLLSLYRNDNAPDFVCLDEILAPIDEGGKELMFEVVAKLQERFRMVIVISHDKMVQERIKNVIIVSKGNDISTIEKQAYDIAVP